MEFTLEHVSASGIKSYLTDGYAWYLKYIKKVPSSQVGPALLVGSACHRFAEHLWSQIKDDKFNKDELTEADVKAIQLYRDELEQRLSSPNVDFGKTGTPEKYLKQYDFAVKAYHSGLYYHSFFCTPGAYVYQVELGFYEPYVHPQTGELGCLDLKGFIDLVTAKDQDGVTEFTIHDHKFVTQYKPEAVDEYHLDPGYWIQAGVYYYGLKAHLEKLGVTNFIIKEACFEECKVTANRDKTSQTRPYNIPFNKFTLAVFNDIYDWVANDMLGRHRYCPDTGLRITPPNPFQMGDYGKEAWREYILHIKY